MNKYKKWYDQIIANGLAVKLPGYERHHILPKSLGGSDNESNLIYITSREHFICHWLLTKIYPIGEEHWKMLNALRMMRAENKNQYRYNTKITSRVYAKIKEEYAKLQSERYSGENNPFFGKSHTKEAKQIISDANTGENNAMKRIEEREKMRQLKIGKKRDPFSDEWKAKMSESASGENNSRYGVTLTDEIKKKIGDKMKGRKQSPETIAKKAEAIRGLKREKKLCPHCNELVAVNGYARWHGDNCKKRKSA
jgi:hypothetical protein